MSQAWEITDEDIATVLRAHGGPTSDENVAAARKHLDENAIIDRLLYYGDFDEQVASANSDIENQLAKAGIIPADTRRFLGPA